MTRDLMSCDVRSRDNVTSSHYVSTSYGRRSRDADFLTETHQVLSHLYGI